MAALRPTRRAAICDPHYGTTIDNRAVPELFRCGPKPDREVGLDISCRRYLSFVSMATPHGNVCAAAMATLVL